MKPHATLKATVGVSDLVCLMSLIFFADFLVVWILTYRPHDRVVYEASVILLFSLVTSIAAYLSRRFTQGVIWNNRLHLKNTVLPSDDANNLNYYGVTVMMVLIGMLGSVAFLSYAFFSKYL